MQIELQHLLGDAPDAYLTQAEIAAWNSLQKTPLIGEYLDKPEAALNDFYFYTVLPLTRLPNLLTMKILSAEDFPFCEGNPINFSFNPRSALAFYLFSQGHADYPDRSLADKTFAAMVTLLSTEGGDFVDQLRGWELFTLESTLS